MIMAGGTGGHVMPALAVAKYLQEQGNHIHWLGTQAGFEARFVPQNGFPISYIDIQGLRRTTWSSWLLAPWRISKAVIQALKILLRERPHVVLSMGGYAAGPGALAALMLRKPLVLHEQNAIAGWTNRLLSGFAKRIMVAFPNVFANKASKVVFTGNPVRQDILSLLRSEASQGIAGTEGIRILILGGSQGAKVLNEVVPQAMAQFAPNARPQIWHQTGKALLEQTQAAYAKEHIQANVTDFINDMAKAYAWADIVICRSGALTVAELASVGVCSILIPFPYAVDDHQTYNAKYLSTNEGAILLSQRELSSDKLYALLQELMNNPQKRQRIAKACKQLAKPLATQDVAKYCLEVSSE
ncbi:MAG: undecaprenyldiphospho-muramoylpentapeptide beta-N-acetylglucosaminyltransferase [Proteobacteria bacterium]|nr:undecaprenyldiphospho-muramoylpentapeptide beta-N-acetylglucosaminyltransferase [Pseudomonadota bacterium]